MIKIHTNNVPLIQLQLVKERFLPCGGEGYVDTQKNGGNENGSKC